MIANCPTDEQLLDFSLGRLAEEHSDELFHHVADCDRCQEFLVEHDASDDTLVDHLKQASVTQRENYIAEDGCRTAMARALALLAATSSDDLIPDDLPDQIGDYKILRLIGRGGMGNVYLAQHTKLGRRVALKVIAGHRAADPKMQGRFETEMQAVGQLSHPNIVAALDAREVDGLAVLITEWIDGLDLGEVIRRTGPLSVGDACRVTEAVVDALSAIHDAGLVHRDIKPSNIMLDRQGDVKLLDLGLARFQDDSATPRELTATGQTIGTADYLAPEQIEARSDVDGRTDVYALGCTLFKLLTGTAPFGGRQWPTAFAKMNAHVSEDPPALGRSQYPADVVQLVAGMLAKQPDQRPGIRQVGKVVRRHAPPADLESLIQKAWTAKPRGEQDESGKPTVAQSLPWYRRPVPLAVALAAGLSGILFGYLLGVIITIKKPDGTTATLDVPDGSHVTIDEEGNAVVEPGKGKENPQPADDAQRIRGIWHAIDDRSWGYVAFAERQAGIFTGIESKPVLYELNSADHSISLTLPFSDESPGMIMEGNYKFLSNAYLELTFIADPDADPTVVRLVKLDPAAVASIDRSANESLFAAMRALEEWNEGKTELPPDMFPARRLNGVWKVNTVWHTSAPGQNSLAAMEVAEYQMVMDRGRLLVLSGDQPVADGVVSLQQRVAGLHATFMFRSPQTEIPYRLPRAFKVDWSRGGLVRTPGSTAEEAIVSRRWPREFSGLLTFSPLDSHSGLIKVKLQPDDDQPEMTILPALRQMTLEQLPIPEKAANLPASLTNPENDDRAAAIAVLFQWKSEYTEFSEEETRKIHRWQSLYHLRQLAYAAHLFHDANNRLPLTIDSVQGRPVSWRVALLPHLGYQELYNRYRFDEPWDSPANSRLLKHMPPAFRHPADSPESNETRYVGFAGGAGGLGQNLEQIADGTSNTLLFVESSTPVPWTKPQDLDFDPDDRLQPQLDWFLQDECNVAFCDSRVRTMKTGPGTDRQTIRGLITHSGGEDVDREDVMKRR